ncbi:BrnT family toxin [Roseiarcus sp.]|uniref:BrnT family toxin n=1 Tax=Roseiarcus sp. TaxID=1969460 RepID=UPI003D097092
MHIQTADSANEPPAVRGFDWDHGNRRKCLKHGMSIADIEAVFTRPVVILPDKENPAGERRLKAIGTTPLGRHAFIVFTWRAEGAGSALLRPISARFMHRKEVETYEKAYPNL